MNINYEDIITKAIARKEQLKAVTAKLEGLDEQAEKLFEALTYFAGMKPLYEALDGEGKLLLGEAGVPFYYSGLEGCDAIALMFGDGQNAYVSRLRDAVDAS